jgi:hypothetical protein
MARQRTPVEKLMLAGQRCAKSPNDDTLASHAAECALEVAHDGLWDQITAALAKAPEAVQASVNEALTHVVERPILVDAAGQVYHGRLFVIPVSQLLSSEDCLQALPQGKTLERLLTEAICPTGKGMLVNRLLPGPVMEAFSYAHAWSLAQDALTVETGQYAEAVDPYIRHEGEGFVSALHFVPFIALVPAREAEDLFSLDEDELAVRTMPVMDALMGIVHDQLDTDQKDAIDLCLHLPQPFFYTIELVELGHETYLFSQTVASWEQAALEEGSILTLSAMLDRHEQHAAVVVTGTIAGEQTGQYRFAVGARDTEMQAEVCATVDEMARQRGLSLQFKGDAVGLADDAVPPAPMASILMDAPRRLQ